jgi:signal transduction histidine kinase
MAPEEGRSPRLSLELNRFWRALLVAAALIVLVTVAVAAGILLDELRLSLKERELVRNAREEGRRLATRLSAELRQTQSLSVAGSHRGFQGDVALLLRANPEVAYLHVVDLEGQIVWSSDPAAPPIWRGRLVSGVQEQSRVPGSDEDEPDILLEMVTTVGDRQPRGAVVLGLSESKVAAELRRGFWTTVAGLSGGGLTLLVALALGYRVLQRRKSELVLRQAREVHLAELGILAAGLVHELRNALHAMRFSLDSLEHRAWQVERRDLAQDMAGIVGEVGQGVADLERIVSSFLAYAGKSGSQTERCDVLAVCRSALNGVAAQLKERGVEARIEGPDRPLEAWLSPGNLQQVLVNLLLNAARACDPGGHVVLRVDAVGAGMRVAVEDDGSGVPASIRPQLFVPFVTGHPQGTGLGLAICRRLVSEMGGTIAYHPRDPRGSIFLVELPHR